MTSRNLRAERKRTDVKRYLTNDIGLHSTWKIWELFRIDILTSYDLAINSTDKISRILGYIVTTTVNTLRVSVSWRHRTLGLSFWTSESIIQPVLCEWKTWRLAFKEYGMSLFENSICTLQQILLRGSGAFSKRRSDEKCIRNCCW
jgi:hypothetical protein